MSNSINVGLGCHSWYGDYFAGFYPASSNAFIIGWLVCFDFVLTVNIFYFVGLLWLFTVKTVLKLCISWLLALQNKFLYKAAWKSFPFSLQIISAITGGITDLSFNAVGYAWQTVNCFLTASYSVSIDVLWF